MSKHLVTNVWVDGVLYTPDSDVPEDVAKQITNPNAWAAKEPSRAERAAELKAEKDAADEAGDDSDDAQPAAKKAAAKKSAAKKTAASE